MGLLDDCEHIFNAAGYCQWCGKSRLFAEAVQLRAEKLAADARIVELSEENAKLREALATLRAAPRKLVEWRNNTTPEAVPYRVEQQQPATVEQGEWRSV